MTGIIHHAELRLGAGVVMFGQPDDRGWFGGDRHSRWRGP